MALAVAANAPAAVYYVDLNSPDPTPPYTNWATAARVIQDAVDAAAAGDEVVVTNGTYATGGRPVGTNVLSNRVAVEKMLALRSVNGPQFTIIQGHQVTNYIYGAVRCVYLASGSRLCGFTLTNGAAPSDSPYYPSDDSNGGGVWCASKTIVISNCVLAGNSAYGYGGGVFGGTLNDCTLSSNRAEIGGGADQCLLNSCLLTGNGCTFMGGGVNDCTLNDCTLTGNSALGDADSTDGGGASCSVLNHCVLTNNSCNGFYSYGGGAFASVLNSCTLISNSAAAPTVDTSYPYGGGAASCTLTDCALIGNFTYGWSQILGPLKDSGSDDLTYYALGSGGGAVSSALSNCTLAGNSADYGGGAYASTLDNCTLSSNAASTSGGGAASDCLNNCIVYSNTAAASANYDANALLNYCCTTPLPTSGVGNITNAPLFVDPAGGNLRLQSNSPGINAGSNDYVTTATDLDGNPRILGGTVDIGAYEFVSPELLVEYLTGLVNESNLAARQSLLASLEAAGASLRRGNRFSAIEQLQAFQRKVRTQLEPVDSALAAEFSRLAQEIYEALQAETGATQCK